MSERSRIDNEYQQILSGQMTTTNVEQAIALLPPLITLSTPVHNNTVMYMRPLVMVLRHSRHQLTEFSGPDDNELCGTETDLEDLHESLCLLSALKKFTWPATLYCRGMVSGNNDNNGDYGSEDEEVNYNPTILDLDKFCRALCKAQAPVTELNIGSCFGVPSALAMKDIFEKKKATLQKLKIDFWHNAQSHLLQGLIDFLSSADCHVKELDVFFWSTCSCFSMAKQMLDVLQDASSLRVLKISPYCEPDEIVDLYQKSAQLLKGNSTLLEFIHHCGTVAVQDLPKISNAFADTLKENTTLRDVRLRCGGGRHPSALLEMDSYIILNRLGRKEIIQNGTTMTRESWVSFMSKDTTNLNWLYFLLQSNPMICKVPPTSISSTAKATRKRKRCVEKSD